jgi:hypothetical protein
VYGKATFPRVAERRLAGRLALGIEQLDVTAASGFGDTPDATRALRGDGQGIGGPPRLDDLVQGGSAVFRSR